MEVTNEQQRRRPDGMEGLGNQKGVISNCLEGKEEDLRGSFCLSKQIMGGMECMTLNHAV
jgi:hypothetical protein